MSVSGSATFYDGGVIESLASFGKPILYGLQLFEREVLIREALRDFQDAGFALQAFVSWRTCHPALRDEADGCDNAADDSDSGIVKKARVSHRACKYA